MGKSTTQGSQFTSEVFTYLVLSNDIKLSTAGKSRACFHRMTLDKCLIRKSIFQSTIHSIDLYKYFDYHNYRKRHKGMQTLSKNEGCPKLHFFIFKIYVDYPFFEHLPKKPLFP